MPTYVYRRKKNDKPFEQLMTFSEHGTGKKPKCPKCDSRAVERVPGQFQAMTKSKT